MITRLAPYFEPIVFVASLLLFSIGLSLIYFPLGLIGAGVVGMAVSLFGGKSK